MKIRKANSDGLLAGKEVSKISNQLNNTIPSKGCQVRTYKGHKKLLFGETLPPIPKGMRGFIIANPGAGKTLFLNWLAYLSAFNNKPVLILDGETPSVQIENNLHRYSLHYGKDWHDLPLTLKLNNELDWDNLKSEEIEPLDPSLVLLESIQSLSGNTNDPNIGRKVKKTLNKVHAYKRWCLVSAHTNQDNFYLTLGELEQLEIPNLARIVKGDTAIVSQGCDIGYLLKQVTAEPLRIAIVLKGRRGYFERRTYYYELQEPEGKEEQMWWKPIPPVKQELTQHALEVRELIEFNQNVKGEHCPIRAGTIISTAATMRTEERRSAIQLLLERGDIHSVAPFVYDVRHAKLNQKPKLKSSKNKTSKLKSPKNRI